MENLNIRNLINEWAQIDSKHKILAALVGRRVSATVADQLVRGKYPQEPRGTMRTVIEEELEKAGILPTLEKNTG